MERIYRIGQLLSRRKSVSRSFLFSALEDSVTTLKLDPEYKRDRLHASAEGRDSGGCRFAAGKAAKTYQLPGLWCRTTGIVALVTTRQLLDTLVDGLLSVLAEPFESWFFNDGRYHFHFPFIDPCEVSLDVLCHVPEVRIESPVWLRQRFTALLEDALRQMQYSSLDEPGSAHNTGFLKPA